MTADIPWQSVKNIVLLNLIGNTIGDNLVKIPVIVALKHAYPQARITMTVSPKNKNAELFTGLKELDELVPVEELVTIGDTNMSRGAKFRRYISLMRTCKKLLQRVKPEVCFVLEPNFALSQLIPYFAGVPYRVGYTYQGSIFSWTLTHKTRFRGAHDTNEPQYHVRETNLDILRCVGVPINPKDKLIHKAVSVESAKWADQFFAQHKLDTKKLIVAIQAGAKWIDRAWPTDRFAKIAQHLVKKHHAQIILIGSSSEQAINDQIAAACGKVTLVINESMEHIAALLKKCSFAFGNDSGIMHLASAVGTTPVVIFGMMCHEHFHPCGPGGYVAIEGPCTPEKPLFVEKTEKVKESMKLITVEQAITAVDKFLEERTQPVKKRKN